MTVITKTKRNLEFVVQPTKAYASKTNAERAVARKGFEDIRHFYACTPDGRWFPIFVGQAALSSGVHFHFNVVG